MHQTAHTCGRNIYDRIKLCISDKAQYGEAVADVRRAIKLAPGSDDVADFAGFVLAPSGYLEEAAKTSVEPGLKLNWSASIDLSPNRGVTHLPCEA
jgi:hypothetical protein